MSTRALREALDELEHFRRNAQVVAPHRPGKAWAELEAIEKAASVLAGDHVGDVMVDHVAHSEEVVSVMTDSRSQWFHPRVTEVGEACEVLKSIAKETK